MNTDSAIFMALSLIVIWGGFIFFVSIGARKK
ncbi:MetS family NSS transporter small subunit [Brachyspira pilosicoli]|nr:MetS family NSS transporter small subunit [Brachyspira pilosicoli]